MPRIPFTTEARLKKKVSASRWLELFDDDNDGKADQQAILEVLNDANADVEAALMKKGYTQAQLEAMAGDDLLSRIGTDIALGYAGERRTEFLDPTTGKSPYHAQRERGDRRLKEIQLGQLRIPAEAEAGGNTQVGGRVSRYRDRATGEGRHVFASSSEDRARGSRGPGGF